jgi:hypothetical protein
MLFVFIGFGLTVMSISFGVATEESGRNSGFHDSLGTSLPILISMVLVFLLGVYNPPAFEAAVQDAARFLTAAQ